MPPSGSDRKMSMRSKYNRDAQYDISQLDLQWHRILQGEINKELQERQRESGSIAFVKNYEAEPRFKLENDLEKGNTIARNYRERSGVTDDVQALYPQLSQPEGLEERALMSDKLPLTEIDRGIRPTSDFDTVDGRGLIDIRQLKHRLLGMDRRELGR